MGAHINSLFTLGSQFDRTILNHTRMDLLGMWVWFNLGHCSHRCEPIVRFGSTKRNKDMENYY